MPTGSLPHLTAQAARYMASKGKAMDGHTVVMRFADGAYQVLYLLAGIPQHAKAFRAVRGDTADTMLYSLMDWTEDGKHYDDEHTIKLVDVQAQSLKDS